MFFTKTSTTGPREIQYLLMWSSPRTPLGRDRRGVASRLRAETPHSGVQARIAETFLSR